MLFQTGINFSKSKVFLIGCLAFIFGLAVASFLPVEYLTPKIYWFASAIFFLILTVLFCRYSEEAGLKPGSLFFFAFNHIIFCCLALRLEPAFRRAG